MRIAIIGCGAMGSIYAGLLSSGGHDVLVVDRYVDHINAINEKGLRISGASGDRTVSVRAFTEMPNDQVDLIIIAVKGSNAGSAAQDARSLMGPDTLVLTIQNGLGSADAVADAIGPDRLIVGVAQGFGASLPEPGHSHHNDMKAIRMGAYASLGFDEVSRIAVIWKEAGFDAEAITNIEAMQWEKLICNVAYSAISALTGLTVGEVMDDPDLGPVSRAAAVEAWTVAKARGIELETSNAEQTVIDFASRMRDAKPSVLLDIEAGRISEINLINGAVPREAKKAGMTTPVNATLVGLVQALERRTQHPTNKR